MTNVCLHVRKVFRGEESRRVPGADGRDEGDFNVSV